MRFCARLTPSLLPPFFLLFMARQIITEIVEINKSHNVTARVHVPVSLWHSASLSLSTWRPQHPSVLAGLGPFNDPFAGRDAAG